MSSTNGTLEAVVSGASVGTVDPHSIIDYLVSVLSVTLGANKRELESEGSLLSTQQKSSTLQRCTQFAVDTQVALYVQKDLQHLHEVAQANGNASKFLDEIVKTLH